MGFPAVAFYSVVTKFAFIMVIIRIFVNIHAPFLTVWAGEYNVVTVLVILSAISSLIIGAASAYAAQRNIKMFIGVASINHMGFILMGLYANTIETRLATILYVLVYVLTNMLFVGGLLQLNWAAKETGWENKPYSLITQNKLAGSVYFQWIYAAFAGVALMSMAGLPPFAGFLAKWYLWKSTLTRINETINASGTSFIDFI
jgi:NADH-quinone oxidoreductase subunit N